MQTYTRGRILVYAYDERIYRKTKPKIDIQFGLYASSYLPQPPPERYFSMVQAIAESMQPIQYQIKYH